MDAVTAAAMAVDNADWTLKELALLASMIPSVIPAVIAAAAAG